MIETISFEERWKHPPEPGDRLWSVYATQSAHERQAAQVKGYQAIRSLWLTELAALPSEISIQALYDVQVKLEKANPDLSDYVGIVLGHLEDCGLVDIGISGKIKLTQIPDRE